MAQPASNFKVIFLSVFVGAAVFGVMVFAGIIPISSGSSATDVTGSVNLWGTLDQTAMIPYMSDYNMRNQKIHITYFQKDADTFDKELVEAIAAGHPPDLVILPDNLMWRFQDKMAHIPYTSLSVQTFQDTFTSSGGIFALSDGFLALPWASDPIVMYYNRDLLQSADMTQPPKDWKAFTDSIPLLVKKQSDLVLTQFATALGTYKNITHLKDIIAMLFMQAKNPFITNGGVSPVMHFGNNVSLAEASSGSKAMDFYTSFANPVKDVYTWNEGEDRDRDLFIQSNLAYYFGTASELPLIRAQNPNLNFGIALPPQATGGTTLTTGRIYGLAIPKTARNTLLSYTAGTLLVSQPSEQSLITAAATSLALMPVRRDVLADKPTTDPYLGMLYSASLIQKSWLDPNPTESTTVFASLIQNINSSILPTDQALEKAAAQLLYLSASI